jgi:hypothetical protein
LPFYLKSKPLHLQFQRPDLAAHGLRKEAREVVRRSALFRVVHANPPLVLDHAAAAVACQHVGLLIAWRNHDCAPEPNIRIRERYDRKLRQRPHETFEHVSDSCLQFVDVGTELSCAKQPSSFRSDDYVTEVVESDVVGVRDARDILRKFGVGRLVVQVQ